MSWHLTTKNPSYLQIMEKIKASDCFPIHWNPINNFQPCESLASEAGVNPNTIQRALSDLEREGFVYSKRTTGRFVTEDKELIAQSRKQLSEEELEQLRFLHDPFWL